VLRKYFGQFTFVTEELANLFAIFLWAYIFARFSADPNDPIRLVNFSQFCASKSKFVTLALTVSGSTFLQIQSCYNKISWTLHTKRRRAT
jgi:heme/copper-type cytochrome/quinol oxidase subunit 3